MRASFSDWQKTKINRSSFGIDRRPNSNEWQEILKGPTHAEFRAHVRKIATFLEPLK